MAQWKDYGTITIYGILTILQIVLWLAGFQRSTLASLVYAGYSLWILFCIFSWLLILVLKRRGGVSRGKSFVHTTRVVDSNIYAVVRHPQHLAGILLNAALILISQHWITLLLSIPAIVLMYIDIVRADQYEIEKFGNEYKRYMEKVSRTNFVLGIFRLIRMRRRS